MNKNDDIHDVYFQIFTYLRDRWPTILSKQDSFYIKQSNIETSAISQVIAHYEKVYHHFIGY